ncbi:uncharacterized protein YifB-like [Ylistrum balloti]|uniref:uncharacterized protein YifB-like n=1 Tax=Ylistrum balloti TaxID=509963 RepID=UPI0029059AA8|nr:uncharacterized protein YifB-like [Ylistrum balloti]
MRGKIVQVEVDICGNFPIVEIVGLPSSEVKESRDRIKIAIKNSGFIWPLKRILINLAPADIKKQGAGFDLPIALAILSVTEQISAFSQPILAVGELQLNGNVRPVLGALAMALSAIEQGIEHFVVHKDNARECSITQRAHFFEITQLIDMQKQYTWQQSKDRDANGITQAEGFFSSPSLADLSHCNALKRTIQIAAAGKHNVLFSGPPGTGKTAGAIRIPSLLPDLSFDDSLELSALYSQNGFSLGARGLLTRRPVRIPHHTATVEGMVGSGASHSLGEITLAHCGILLLDEAPEFKMKVLQALREPLDQQYVTISRAGHKWDYPADFQLILTTNLCPCGNLGKSQHSKEWCLCSET